MHGASNRKGVCFLFLVLDRAGYPSEEEASTTDLVCRAELRQSHQLSCDGLDFDLSVVQFQLELELASLTCALASVTVCSEMLREARAAAREISGIVSLDLLILGPFGVRRG